MKDVLIACDFGGKKELLAFLGLFTEEKPYLKIGMELFYGEGPNIVRAVKGLGFPVFLDLKLHDIPNTARKTMKNLARLGVDMTNVHAAGTRAMMEAAREGLDEGAAAVSRPALIAVTQLTSTSGEALRHELLVETGMTETVVRYAMNARDAGLDGVVCSPLEVRQVKAACGDRFWAVTPGIRYAESGKDDQARVATPAIARELGADYIVVGRPITAAPDPVAAYRRARTDFRGV
jgi:orotidine-5'-phosphate decarboxylase